MHQSRVSERDPRVVCTEEMPDEDREANDAPEPVEVRGGGRVFVHPPKAEVVDDCPPFSLAAGGVAGGT